MGLDMRYQAIPDDCVLLKRVKQDSGFGQYIGSFVFQESEKTGYLERLRELAERGEVISQQEIDYAEEEKRTLTLYPEITQHYLAIGRTWGLLYYILSGEVWKGEITDDKDIGAKAIFGYEKIQSVFSGQGLPVRYSSPDVVKQIVQMLSTWTKGAFITYFDLPAMVDAGVYKAVQFGENDFEVIWDTFEKLRAFYTLVLEHNEGVIAYLY
jgi:hypothetical protein